MMLCLFGVQLLALGTVGELLTRTHFESHADPVCQQSRSHGFAGEAIAAKKAVRQT